VKTLARRIEGRSAMQRADELGKRAEYLAFTLGSEAYAIEIGSIVEILKPLPIKLARTFTMDRKSRILLVDAVDEEIGLLVDEVLQVFRLSEAEIEPPTVLGTEQPPHVVGIGRPQGGAVLMLLDLAPLFAE